jgi:hypothetical protein
LWCITPELENGQQTMRGSRSQGPVALLFCLVAAGCGERNPVEPPLPISAALSEGGRLRVYNMGLDRAVPQQPCRNDANHRAFDFWLGHWRARGAAAPPTAPGVASEIKSLLDGCVVGEFWGGPVRGRSINAYDRDDGQWHQTWVTSAHLGHLRLSGGLQSTDMLMAGVRTQPNLVEWHDTYRWTPQGHDTVTQAFAITVRRGATIFFQTSGAIRYTRDERALPPPEIVLNECQPGGPAPQARELDFWLGQWSVANNDVRLGTAVVSSGLSGCLTEENYSTRKGYRAISFAYFDAIEQQWYRTYVDSEGERVELHGNLVGPDMIMTGVEPGPGGTMLQVRMTLSPVDANTVRQNWEVSDDNGASWRSNLSLTYRRATADNRR